ARVALAVPAEQRIVGDQAWAALDTGPRGAFDRFGGMALSANGATVFVARSSDGVFVVVARDAATGERRWIRRTRGPGGAQACADGIAVSGSRVFVTGEVERTVDTRTPLTVAFDGADGSVLWKAAPDVAAHPEVIPRRIAVSPDGTRVFVTGSRTGSFD